MRWLRSVFSKFANQPTSQPTLEQSVLYTRLSTSTVTLNELWWNGTKQQWNDALVYYWTLIKPDHIPVEKQFEKIGMKDIASLSTQQFFDFLYHEYFFWKYTAANRLVTTRRQLMRYQAEDRMDELKQIQTELVSFDTSDTLRGLEIAKQIRGLGVAGASGLLAVLLPQDFGTVDQFVVKSLTKIQGLPKHDRIVQMNPESLTLQDGQLLIQIMKEKAKELNRQFEIDEWTPRALDKVLWSKGRT